MQNITIPINKLFYSNMQQTHKENKCIEIIINCKKYFIYILVLSKD